MRRTTVAIAIVLSTTLTAATCNEPEPEDSCEGHSYTATIVAPEDGATGVPLDVKVRSQFSGDPPDRYESVEGPGGDFVPSTGGGFDADGEWSTYALQPNTTYTVTAGWVCFVEDPKEMPLAMATFTTAP